ncbi:melatonin receptor type 1B-B-like [Diadema antillarum]|uniref:melatonin receptor type 1B-B-like n=1 Tax=Diadema antillarum TaxID=105358 RepID=UPI003A840911
MTATMNGSVVSTLFTEILWVSDHAESTAVRVTNVHYVNPYQDDDVVNELLLLVTVFMFVVGCIGNVLVIWAVLTHRKLRILGNAFVVNLAVADLCVSAFLNPFAITGLVTAGEFFSDKEALCQIIGVVCITSCSCSMWSIASVGVNRYVAIVHRNVYHQIFNRRTLPLLLILLWGTCFLIDMPNLVGWGAHSFDPKLMLCTYNYTTSYSYTFFFIATGFGIPLSALIFCYSRIFIYARRSTKEIDSLKKSDMSASATKQESIRNSDLRLLRSVLTIVIVFLIMWSPYAVIVVFDFKATWPRTVYVVALVMAHMNSCINSIIYGATNRNFRQAYARLICAVFTCGLRRDAGNTESGSVNKSKNTSESGF